MAEKNFLHDTQDFLAVLDRVSQRMKIAPQFVEKDYWLMHSLWALHHLGLYYELKGGTSLSKGWELISRFSEDVDIKIIPPEGMSVASSKNHTQPRHRESRSKYFDWLVSILAIPGASYVQRDHEFDDHDLRNAGFRLGYKSHFDEIPGLKYDVLLEVGFDVTTPNEKKDISSWAFDEARSLGIDNLDNRARAVPCYLPEYTFVEKLSAISKKYRQDVDGKDVKNFTRHYYDIYQLLNEPRVQAFIGTEAYLTHKSARLNKGNEDDIKNNPAFSLPDASVRKKYADRLQNTASLYFHGQPTIEEILARISLYIDKL